MDLFASTRWNFKKFYGIFQNSGPVVSVAKAELAGLVPPPGPHLALIADGEAVRRVAVLGHLERDGENGKGDKGGENGEGEDGEEKDENEDVQEVPLKWPPKKFSESPALHEILYSKLFFSDFTQ